MTTLGLFNLMGLHDRNTSPMSVLRTTVDMVAMAEDFGFDIAWFAEHHFTNHSICPSALMMISHCAARTSRVRLGTAVLALPFHNPIRLVQEAAFADLLASGRLVLGLGAGYQPYEFDRFDIEESTKIDRMMEIWDILEQGLTKGYVAYEGRHYRIPPTELSMRPFGLSMPDLYVASRRPEVIARCARGGHTPFMSFGHRGLAPAVAAKEKLLTMWADGGGERSAMPLAIQRFIYVTEERDDALHAARCVRDFARAWVTLHERNLEKEGPFVRLMPLNDEPPLDDFLESAVIGPPEYCVEKLREELSALRPSHLCCLMGPAGIGRSETLASLERFGFEVVPHLSEWLSLGQSDDLAA
ncbi:LLM class flavin-dependent oxidoreductase [Aureimonas populi]|uniref:LLM class flavin-dependent oxidoreductase n=1 Tax=Aureimonas populi TaxID=1701758 RepID=A0ABW5CMS9_9HYPH|nr:LLM class flavin-dependent oxidoreductase [Aureimonas populi]